MIILGKIGDAAELLKTCDEVHLIVRSPREIKGVRWTPVLSPSKALFWDYRKWEKQGQWNAECFAQRYAPRFLREMADSSEARAMLNELWKKDRAGKKIALLCFCGIESLCHRSIVGGLLKGAGCEVKTLRGDGSEYVKYYEQFKALR